jgi:hypothetical protein
MLVVSGQRIAVRSTTGFLRTMTSQWEYITLKIPTDFGFFSGTDFDSDQFADLLNAQGAEGWELVSVFDIEKVKGGSKFVIAVMKRPKE